MVQGPSNSSGVRAWLLLGDKAGDNAQLRALAAAAGLAVEEKHPVLNARASLPNVVLGASGLSLRDADSAGLRAPWPGVVLASGRKNSAVARWIRRQSGGQTKLVHVGRPWAPLGWFDLVLTQPQYQLPARANVHRSALPFNQLAPARLQAGAARWQTIWAHLPRPWLGLIVGGPARPLVLDAARAGEIGRQASALARQLGGALLVCTSRRTPTAAADALVAAIDAPHFVFRWSAAAKPDDNPYVGLVALADRLIVTGDSASMLAEALRSAKPVMIAPLAARLDLRRRLANALQACLPAPLFDRLVGAGLVNSTRDLRKLIQPLLDAGIVAALDGPARAPGAFIDDLPAAATRLRALIGS